MENISFNASFGRKSKGAMLAGLLLLLALAAFLLLYFLVIKPKQAASALQRRVLVETVPVYERSIPGTSDFIAAISKDALVRGPASAPSVPRAGRVPVAQSTQPHARESVKTYDQVVRDQRTTAKPPPVSAVSGFGAVPNLDMTYTTSLRV